MDTPSSGGGSDARDDVLPELRALRTTLECLQAEMRRTPPHATARIDGQVRRLIALGQAHQAIRARMGPPERFLRGRDLQLFALEKRVRRLEEAILPHSQGSMGPPAT